MATNLENLRKISQNKRSDDRLLETETFLKENLLNFKNEFGYWQFPLEADITLLSEFIIFSEMTLDFDSIISDHGAEFRQYFIETQNDDGSWPLYYGGKGDISATTKAYIAFNLLRRGRAWCWHENDEEMLNKSLWFIRDNGGAEKSNVFTRILLAQIGLLPWDATPVIASEITLLPSWFPFNKYKVSYWSRCVMLPLSILRTTKKTWSINASNLDKIFVERDFKKRVWFEPSVGVIGFGIKVIDRVANVVDKIIPKFLRKPGIWATKRWLTNEINKNGTVGAIFPALTNSYLALLAAPGKRDDYCLGVLKDRIKSLVYEYEDIAFVQPCVSPVWDTAISCLALLAAGENVDDAQSYLLAQEIRGQSAGMIHAKKPKARAGGWAFQDSNPNYPDVDDTAMVMIGLLKSGQIYSTDPIVARNIEWILSLQSDNGGWGAFDRNNDSYWLNDIPFADHGALLDPPTADVTARCLWLLSLLTETPTIKEAKLKAIEFILSEQEDDGSWFGRWGTNYIYGTWSAVTALIAAGIPKSHNSIRSAAEFIRSARKITGMYGESNRSYERYEYTTGEDSVFQTSLAILALIQMGELNYASYSVEKIIEEVNQEEKFFSSEFAFDYHNAPGFPKVFYLRYHGYDKYFPLWAISAYRNALEKHS